MNIPLKSTQAPQASASLYPPYKASASHVSPCAALTASTYTRYSTIPPYTSSCHKRCFNGPAWNVQTASTEGWNYSSTHASAPRARRKDEDTHIGRGP